jgi:hypothetical protein
MATQQNESFWNWLGRQVGHVRKAIHTEVTEPLPTNQPKVLYRQDRVEEQPMPSDPSMKLRRTTIDEVIADVPEPPNSKT